MTDVAANADYLAQLRGDMTERMWRFAVHYAGPVCSGNGTKAARMAGYEGDDATLAVTAYRLLRNDKVVAVLAAFHEGDEATASVIEHGHWLTRVMRGQEKELRYVGRDEDGKSIMEECAPSIKERLSAQDQLAKLRGYYVTKVAPVNTQGEDLKSWKIEDLLQLQQLGKVGT